MMMRILINLLFLLLAFSLKAQDKIDITKALKVGQELPVLPAMKLLNYGTKEIYWDKLKDKVIILDFFDTYCSNCIRDMPKLQQLQDELNDKLQIVLVTWQDKETIEKFYANNAYLKKNKVHLPTIYADTLLKVYFPHKGVPHTAWLFQNKVQAITFADFSTVDNIRKLYNEGSLKLPYKSDFAEGEDQMQSNILSENLIGSVELTGYIDGIPSGGLKVVYDSINNTTTSTISNLDILGAYTSIWSKIKRPEYLLKEQRIFWKVPNPDRYRYKGGAERNIWVMNNGINYKRLDSFFKSEKETARLILHDLNSFLGLNVYWEKREIPCLVLQKLDNDIEIDKRENEGLEGTSVFAFMVDYQTDLPPVCDVVKSMRLLNIDDYSSLEIINEQLEKYGLVLIDGMREMEVLVFEEIQ